MIIEEEEKAFLSKTKQEIHVIIRDYVSTWKKRTSPLTLRSRAYRMF